MVGSVVISLDCELGWGRHRDVPSGEFVTEGRRNWLRLLRLFDQYDVPATWAIVGHLFLEDCTHQHEGHPAGERCCRRSIDGVPPEQVWFAPDLIEEVMAASVDHEIGCHTFTHRRLDHPSVDQETAERELEESVMTASSWDLDLRSFVFPVNRVAHRNVLREGGIDCYRGRNPLLSSQTDVTRRVGKVRDAFIKTTAPPIVTPYVDEYGLVNVPASQFLYGFEGRARKAATAVRGDPMVMKAKAGIDAAASSDGVFHLWFHPHDFEGRPSGRVRPILEHLRERTESTDLRVETMGDVADRIAPSSPFETTMHRATAVDPVDAP